MVGRKKYVTSVETGTRHIEDTYEGEVTLEITLGGKYLGDQISVDGKNYLNKAYRRIKGAGLRKKQNKCTTCGNDGMK